MTKLEKVKTLFEGLGSSPSQIARTLELQGSKGIRRSPESCVLANVGKELVPNLYIEGCMAIDMDAFATVSAKLKSMNINQVMELAKRGAVRVLRSRDGGESLAICVDNREGMELFGLEEGQHFVRLGDELVIFQSGFDTGEYPNLIGD